MPDIRTAYPQDKPVISSVKTVLSWFIQILGMESIKINQLLGILLIILAGILVAGCSQTSRPTEVMNATSVESPASATTTLQCRSDTECRSGVCDFIKQDMGTCADTKCSPGSQAQGIYDISFFCNRDGHWEKIKKTGDPCMHNYECYTRTCKDAPDCPPGDYLTSCKNGICVLEQQRNECELKGLKRITVKEDADQNRDGSCFKTLAQRELKTVCSPCGNGVCERELESKCNCPADCP